MNFLVLIFVSVFIFLLAPSDAIADNHTESVVYSTINGRELYVKFCADCHGISGEPPAELIHTLNPSPVDLRTKVYRYGNTPKEVFTTIKEGRGSNMIGFSDRLADEQIRALVDYLAELRNLGGSDS